MELKSIRSCICEIRDQWVILDFDLAALYQVQTKVLKQAVRRNLNRFPDDFMFELSAREFYILRSQFVTSSSYHNEDPLVRLAWGGIRYQPFAFTEQGVAMLSSVLKNEVAIQVNIAIMRAFVEMRRFASNYKELEERLFQLEQNCDRKFVDINEALKYLMEERSGQESMNDRRIIGFTKEKSND